MTHTGNVLCLVTLTFDTLTPKINEFPGPAVEHFFVKYGNPSYTDFTARRYASAVYAVVVCPSVRLSVRVTVCLSHTDIVPKRLNVASRKQRHTIVQGI